jgi:hypothetical protein
LQADEVDELPTISLLLNSVLKRRNALNHRVRTLRPSIRQWPQHRPQESSLSKEVVPSLPTTSLIECLLAEVGATHVVVMPTADAFENPGDLVTAATVWAERLGVSVEPLMVMGRSDALEPGPASVIDSAVAVYLVGDSPIHLRSVLTGTAVWESICALVARGGLVVGVGGSAAALCDPMTDPRGGAFTIGLGLIRDMAALPKPKPGLRSAFIAPVSSLM